MNTKYRCCAGGVVLAALLALSAGGLAAAPQLQVNPTAAGVELSLDGRPFHTTSHAVVNERLIAVPESSVLLVLWNEVSPAGATPFYAISLDGRTIARVRETSYTLLLRQGPFDPASGAPGVEPGLAADSGTNVYIVQFVTQPLDPFRAQIEKLGGTIDWFIGNHAYLVTMSPAVRAAVAALPYVRWVGPYHPAYRLDETLRQPPRWDAKEPFPIDRYNVMVIRPGLETKWAVAEYIRALGGHVDQLDAGKYLLVATLTWEQLYAVARLDEVLFVDRWGPYEVDMDIARQAGGANHIETVAGYRGQGVRGEAFDIGFNVAHMDFASRPLILHGAVSNDSHGAATSGIVFGDGAGNANARGLLPAGQGVVGDMDTVGLTGTGRYNHTAQQVQAPYFVVFETASVGSPQTSLYTTISAETDAMLFDFDVVHCQSQSNVGNTNSRPQAWAKNIVSGGGIYHYNTLSWADDRWNGGASTGPAADGRIKPDLAAYYDQILTTSCCAVNSYTTTFGGTSGATPIICGHIGLFFQMWADGLFGNPVIPGGSVFDNRCHMTTAKAMIIHNARQYTFSGSTHDLSRVKQGWGWPDVRRMYDLREKFFIIDETDVLRNLQVATYVLNVDAGETEFRATMTYADPAGNPSSPRHRINDLTLKVTSPSGVVYWGNNGLLANMYSTPGGSPNVVDTVENVLLQNPEPGGWTVQVFADEVVQDARPETPGVIDVDFALVVSPVTPCSRAGTIRLDRPSYNCATSATIRVTDCDLNTNPNQVETVTITIASTSEPAGESVLLAETGPNTSAFVGSIPLAASGGAGVLVVAHGDTVTATYVDQNNGQGQIVIVTATATVDCAAPVVSNVQAVNIQARSADVTFAANEPVRSTVLYGLSCGNLNQSAGQATLETNPVIALTGLNPSTRYYFAVRAEDAAGNTTYDDNGGACYTFVTTRVPLYFTELFTTNNDLDNYSLTFTPNAPADFYRGCAETITALPTPPAGGTVLTLTDDSFATINLSGVSVRLYGTSYTTFYVGSNGYITFVSGDTTYTETLEAHFNRPRISALFDDLNPATGGQVSWRQLADRVAVTWLNVPEYGTTNQNTFQIEMFFDGRLRISYLAIAAVDGLAGLSRGAGVPVDYSTTDLTAMGACVLRGDLNCDGAVNTFDIDPFVLALTNPTAYQQQYPNCNIMAADCNQDGQINAFDIDPFVALLGG